VALIQAIASSRLIIIAITGATSREVKGMQSNEKPE
jgi:hypothetical protein